MSRQRDIREQEARIRSLEGQLGARQEYLSSCGMDVYTNSYGLSYQLGKEREYLNYLRGMVKDENGNWF